MVFQPVGSGGVYRGTGAETPGRDRGTLCDGEAAPGAPAAGAATAQRLANPLPEPLRPHALGRLVNQADLKAKHVSGPHFSIATHRQPNGPRPCWAQRVGKEMSGVKSRANEYAARAAA